MDTRAKNISQAGVSLIEVLITLVVLGMGLMSLAKFQATVMQDNGLAKGRTVAVHLAEQKIGDLRKYEVLATTAGRFAYQDISSNNDAPTVSSVPYTRNWTVTNYCFPTNYTTTATTPCPVGTVYPDFKVVTVTVSWTDQDSNSQSVRLDTMISAADPSDTGRIIEKL